MKDKLKVISIISVLVIAISCGLLMVLPGQFFHYGESEIAKTFASGYSFIFKGNQYLVNNDLGLKVCGTGIAALVLLNIALICFVPGMFKGEKINAVELLGGITMVVSGFLFLMMQVWTENLYPSKAGQVHILWVAYVVGALVAICGIIALALSIKSLVNEAKKPYTPKSAYSYLKNK